MAHWAVRILLSAGTVAVTIGSLGILMGRTVFDRLHYAGLISSVGTMCMVAAVVIAEGWSQAGTKALLIGLLILFMNPVLAHATARAARVRQYGKLMPEPEERIRFRDQPGYVGPQEPGAGSNLANAPESSEENNR